MHGVYDKAAAVDSIIADGNQYRTILEWIKDLPANWYGFFARKDPKRFPGFVPFTDAVVVLDYILGEEEPAAAAVYLADLDAVGKTIQALFRSALEEPYWRPLYLSMFIEVWVNKAGAVDITGAKQLLKAYLEKETGRWKVLLKDGHLVNSYLRLLTMACVTERFNITDVSGENYLQEDCGRLSVFLDEQDRCPGTQSVFADLFVQQDELETYDPEDGLLLHVHDQLSQSGAPPLVEDLALGDGIFPEEDPAPDEAPSREKPMTQDEVFVFLAPYIKVEANPEEFYLCLLNGAGALSEEESRRLAELREERIRKTAELPDYAWIIAPAFPDIIREYLVLHVVKLREAVPFTRLARANSVYSLGQFLIRAVEDWPETIRICQGWPCSAVTTGQN